MRTQAERRRLLERRISESGLSTTAFAKEVLLRSPRSVRRVLQGNTIPDVVADWLETPSLRPWPFSTVRQANE